MKKCYLFFALFLLAYNSYGQQWGIEGRNLNFAVKDGHVDSVWSGVDMAHGFSGKDVIIGVTDWGFDYSHPVFYDTAINNYRVLRAWDQYRTGGPAPEGFDYGTELIGKEALLAAQCDTSNVYSYGYHGTHVASIAAGAGAGTSYRGVAYDANLLFVSIAISEQAIEDAFRWMYKVAQEEQKRLVINMSWGLYYMGNMDGTGKMANLVDSLSNLGVVFVTSAGNNGDEFFHLSHTFSSSNDTVKSGIGFTNINKEWGQSISMTNNANTSFSFAIQAINKPSVLATSPYYSTDNGNSYIDTFLVVWYNDTLADTLVYNVSIEQKNQYNDRPQVRFRVKRPSLNYKVGLLVSSNEGTFHAWNVAELENEVGNWGGNFSSEGMTGWVSGDKNCGIGTPANMSSVISVAAHQSIKKVGAITQGGYICSFSSYGKTIDDRFKPEISGPGYEVMAAISSFADGVSSSGFTTVEHNGRDYPFAGLSGTSMSSPFVAGVVALMLQANPYLSTEQVKNILMETAYSDNYVKMGGEIRFGAGKVNAYRAVMKALEITGVSDSHTEEIRVTLFPNPATDLIYFSIQADENPIIMELFDLQGRKLSQQIMNSGVNTLNVAFLTSGYYIVKLSDGKKTCVKKFVKK